MSEEYPPLLLLLPLPLLLLTTPFATSTRIPSSTPSSPLHHILLLFHSLLVLHSLLFFLLILFDVFPHPSNIPPSSSDLSPDLLLIFLLLLSFPPTSSLLPPLPYLLLFNSIASFTFPFPPLLTLQLISLAIPHFHIPIPLLHSPPPFNLPPFFPAPRRPHNISR